METGDRKLNEVKKVTDMAYVPVIMADGSIGQIAKSDLASVVAGVIGDANQNKSGLLSISNYKKSPIDLLMSAGKLYEIAKICKDYRSAIIEVYGVKSPSWDTNKPIQTVIIGMHTDNTVKQAIDVRKDSDMIDVYYDSSSVYIKNNYTYTIQVNIVFKQMGDKGDEFMIPALSTKDVSDLNKAREVGTVFGYNSLAELAGGVASEIAPIIRKSIDDCNNADTGYYSFTAAPTNSPADDGGILLCIKSFPMVFQLYMSDAYGLFYRHKWYDNDWVGWANVRS